MLTRVNRDAVAVQRALASVGVPAVISMLSSVFTTPSARDWLVLLSALARPGVSGFVSAAALTPFVGWTATDLAEASDERRDQLADLLRTWSRVLDDHGVASLLEATAAAGLRERLVRLPDGERRLTDVRHVGEALHAAATDDGLGAAALLEWLRARIDEAGQDYAEERSRRLETDTAAVQVITVHASKGLQFPVVLVPFLWDKYTPPSPATIGYDRDDVRLLHVGGKGSPGYDDARAAGAAADDGEGLRLAYVALTRATSQVVAWWAPSANSVRGALTRLLLSARDADGNPAELVKTTTDAATTSAAAGTATTPWSSRSSTSAPVVGPWAPPASPDGGPARGDARPAARRGVAPHLVLGADGRGARCRGGARTGRVRAGVPGGAGRARRSDGQPRQRPRRRSRSRRPLPDGRPPVRHRVRHVRPPRPGARRHERPGPGRGADRPLRAS